MAGGGQPDAVLLIGFGGPEKPDEIMPYLQTVVRGRNIPPERLAEVAGHYEALGGRSPYNELTFEQARALEEALAEAGRPLPVFCGMRNWHPFLKDTLAEMAGKGHRRAIGVILAAHRSPESDERYVGDVDRARAAVGEAAPEVDYLPPWFDNPLFIEANAARLTEALPGRSSPWPTDVPVVFTAHSIPMSAAEGSSYVPDLQATCGAVAELLNLPRWMLAYQSRSGDPRAPWLEPDIRDVLRDLSADAVRKVVVQPIGFLCDHVEVLWDLDVEARKTAEEVGLTYHRAGTVGSHPRFIQMLAELVQERLDA